MTYTAYETAATAVLNSVQAHCRHLTTGGSFSTASTPPLTRVEQWIDETYYGLQAALSKEGYSISVPASATAVLGFLERLNVYGAVMQVELAHPVTGRRGEPNERFNAYKQLYDDGISMLATDALSTMGLNRTTELSAFVEVGGISKAQKRVLYEDTDSVQPRFRRDFGRSPITVNPPAVSDQGTA